ncbi:Asp/Glu/hydantoin racemase [Pseudooceanicola sp. GBMRC 2024]|uniref:Asp/Glu/hydantoin racemase n=1 Tax=Pseudooceanicola albus TaxID=2692189 RepID=A0A6L7G162_9RHOB|nr:aspartate/glutamate racemase family protein [Pseudooceanicola albus]MXN17791.1 Asp/Glu/hydantoin racemase [Pseudooceanicola albus]
MRILVINPNSSATVTEGIAEALAPLDATFTVICRPDGPETIRTDQHVAEAAPDMAALVAAHPDQDGYITACFSDPGLDGMRQVTPAPVTGAQEAAVLEACDLAPKFGIIALSERAIPRHLARIRALGLADRLVAELPLRDVSAAESGSDPAVYALILQLAVQLRDMGAGAVVLGCAGMAPLAARLQADLGLPVIDPVAAAGRLALRRAQKGFSR